MLGSQIRSLTGSLTVAFYAMKSLGLPLTACQYFYFFLFVLLTVENPNLTLHKILLLVILF